MQRSSMNTRRNPTSERQYTQPVRTASPQTNVPLLGRSNGHRMIENLVWSSGSQHKLARGPLADLIQRPWPLIVMS